MNKENQKNKTDYPQDNNKKTSPTDIVGKDMDNANATNSGAGHVPIEEAHNPALDNEKIEEDHKNNLNHEVNKSREHDTNQDPDRYNGSKNNSGMDTDLNRSERSENENILKNTQDKTDGI